MDRVADWSEMQSICDSDGGEVEAAAREIGQQFAGRGLRVAFQDVGGFLWSPRPCDEAVVTEA